MTNEDAIRVFESWIEQDKNLKYADRLENIEIYQIAIEALKAQRPHGEWIEQGYSDQMAWATCSICRKKEKQMYNESPDATEETMVICKPFCPNCGSDNRKKSPCDHCIDDSDCDRCDVPRERR